MHHRHSLSRRELILAGTVAAVSTPAGAAPGAVTDPGGETIVLWPNGAPGGERVTVREEIIERLPDGPMRDRYAQHVTRPTFTFFEPKGTWNGVTLLIIPGGGYVRVVIDKEGFEAAEWFTEHGFAAAVLRYRLPADGWTAGADAPVHDAMRALRVLRRLAARESRRIGVIGFSAGGHLSARLITAPGVAYPRQDAADDGSAMPDFAVLMYPVIATVGPAAHPGSAKQLIESGVASGDLWRFSPDRQVNERTPATLLVHAADDRSVPVDNSLLMYQALRKSGVRSELHVFDSGGHGFGLRGVAGRNVAVWPELVRNWALSNESPKD